MACLYQHLNVPDLQYSWKKKKKANCRSPSITALWSVTYMQQMACSTALSFRLFSVKRGPPSKNDECLEISHLFRKWLTSTQSFWMHVIASIVSFLGTTNQKYDFPDQKYGQKTWPKKCMERAKKDTYFGCCDMCRGLKWTHIFDDV